MEKEKIYYNKYLRYKLKYLKAKNTEDNKIVNKDIKFIQQIFEDASINDLKKLIITSESVYSVSKISGSKFLYKIINKYYNNTSNLILTDGTANIGSDSINLSKYFKQINSIELSKVNYNALINNIKVLNKKNIITYNKDTTKILSTLKQDIIYIDAPWGGVDYKLKDMIDLFIGNINISNFYKRNKYYAKLFIFKVPTNYNIKLMKKVAELKIYDYYLNNKHKYCLIVIDNRHT